MGKICFFPKCVPKSRDYVVFPFTRNREFENWWIKSGWADVIGLDRLPRKILICEEHFEKDRINRRYKVPQLALGSLPTRNIDIPAKKRDPCKTLPQNKELFLHRVFCRLCGQMQASNLDDDLTLLTKLDGIFQQQLQLSDCGQLPLGVCVKCRDTANIIQAFWKECTEAQETLKTIFNNDHTIDVLVPPEVDGTKQTSSNYEDTGSVSTREEDHMYLNKDNFVAECEEIEIDTTTSQHLDESFSNEYVYESYGEELPVMQPHSSQNPSTVDECEQMEINAADIQLLPDNYTIEYVDDSSSQDLHAAFADTIEVENIESERNVDKKLLKQEAHMCEICGKTLKTRHRLKSHMSVHTQERDHQCNICGHKFKVRRALMEHIESKHERRLFPCSICGVQYRWQKGLQRHMASHKGTALKHSCRVCGKSFSVPHQLKHHMMLHTGDRIECDICGKGYRFNYMLTQHKIRVHNMVIEGVKLYATSKQRKQLVKK